jgi:hypothetical protein
VTKKKLKRERKKVFLRNSLKIQDLVLIKITAEKVKIETYRELRVETKIKLHCKKIAYRRA